jgi:hypothetical protein
MSIHIKRKILWLRRVAVAASVVVAMAGCAALRNSEAVETERVLAAAGFEKKFADTLEKRAHLATLTQRKLVSHPDDGAVRYVYADATSCKCIYVGDEAAYQRYRTLAIQQRIANEQRVASDINEGADIDWGIWKSGKTNRL